MDSGCPHMALPHFKNPVYDTLCIINAKSAPGDQGRAGGRTVLTETGEPPAGAHAGGKTLKVLLASPRSFCAGVQRAIETVERLLERRAGPVYVRKQIVHNAAVVAELQDRGAIFVDELDDVPDPAPPGTVVVFSAHGVAPAVRVAATQRGLQVVDATCPLVAKVHAEAARLAARGDTVVLIGHRGHDESEGTMGVAPNSMVLVQGVADLGAVSIPAEASVSYLTQTTLAVDDTAPVIDALRQRWPGLHDPPSDDICYATTNRQRALQAIVDECDVVLVVGSQNSSNCQRLVEVAQRRGTLAYLIDGPDDLDLAWFDTAETIGITAGASAPPRMVQHVVDALGSLGSIIVTERSLTTETARFSLPKPVRKL